MTTLQTTRRTWTYVDYLQLEDSPRYEVMNGELHSVPAPDLIHQRVVRNISVSLWDFVRNHRCGEVFWSPIDVVLGDKQTTVVQPDVVYVAAGNTSRLLRRRGVFGAPDLVIEVLSPATGERDRVHKLALYESAGVREYWLLDPAKQRGDVYCLQTPGPTRKFKRGARAVLKSESESELQSRILPGWSVDLQNLFG
ncbi:MAG: Uma2 family endonuclease [Leptospirales bacterium]|jgi:Uma2 family endonuclease